MQRIKTHPFFCKTRCDCYWTAISMSMHNLNKYELIAHTKRRQKRDAQSKRDEGAIWVAAPRNVYACAHELRFEHEEFRRGAMVGWWVGTLILLALPIHEELVRHHLFMLICAIFLRVNELSCENGIGQHFARVLQVFRRSQWMR